MLLIVTLGVGMRVIRRADMINEWRILRIIQFRCFLVSMGVILFSRGYLLRLALYVPLPLIPYPLSIPFRISPSLSHFPYVLSAVPLSRVSLSPSFDVLGLFFCFPANPDSSQMTPVFSGGLVYEWSQETSHYGLVELSNGNITLLQDYQNLKAEFASTSMPSGDGGYKASGSASTCPVNGTDFTSWAVLPALPEGAQNYIDKGAGKALGYSGPSNQGAGGAVRPPSHSPH